MKRCDGAHTHFCCRTGAAGGISFDELYASLQHSIISHSRLLRLSSLRVLMSPLVDCPADVQEVLKRCLQGEEVPLDVQGVRERILRIGRVGPVVKDGDKIGADLCGRWLIGTSASFSNAQPRR